MDYKDYYKTLGVARDADEKTIKSAYRKLARKHHPDVNKGSAERFKEISEAHTVLSDPEKRKRYDTLGPDWERFAKAGANPGAGARSSVRGPGHSLRRRRRRPLGLLPHDLRRGRPGPRARRLQRGPVRRLGDLGGGGWGGVITDRGGDVEAGVEITLEEAFQGIRRTIALELDEPCPTCGGAGHVNRKPCTTCRGTGWSRAAATSK